jgi:hypothetical protein
VVARAEEKGAGRLALKAMARSRLAQGATKPYAKCWYEPIDDPELALLSLRFTLSQPITAAIPPGDQNLFRLALSLAEKVTPITEAEIQVLREKAKESTPLFRLAAA